MSAIHRATKHCCGSFTLCMWKLLLFPNSWLQNWVDLLEGSCLDPFSQWCNLSLPVKYDLWLRGNVRAQGAVLDGAQLLCILTLSCVYGSNVTWGVRLFSTMSMLLCLCVITCIYDTLLSVQYKNVLSSH